MKYWLGTLLKTLSTDLITNTRPRHLGIWCRFHSIIQTIYVEKNKHDRMKLIKHKY